MKAMKDYKYHAGIVLRIYPSDCQKHLIAVNSGCQRYVYNHLVAVNNEIYCLSKTAEFVPCDRQRIDYLKSVRHHSDIANQAPFLYGSEVDKYVIDNAIINYQTAWKNQKERHLGAPVFHKKGYAQSYQTNCHYSKNGTGSVRFLDESHLILPILKRIRFAGSKKRIWQILDRSHETTDNFIRIGTVTISRDACGDYFVSLALASDEPFRECRSVDKDSLHDPIGIDMNLSNFCTMSDSMVIPNPKYRKSLQPKIAKAQRKASRRMERAKADGKALKDAKNYQKARRQLAHLHRHYTRQRDDFIGCTSNDAVKNHDFIAVEHLNIKGLLKNHNLAMAISDAGWYKFQTAVSQKAAAEGIPFIRVPAKNTTQKCSRCGHICHGDEKIVLGQDEWDCPECGAHNMRDVNAAINILRLGLQILSET